MKTITFYSYKGGVGRSLALSNIAIKLSEFNKKVCVLDFDLEAPGLPFKFKNYAKNRRAHKGIVDYIHDFTSKGFIGKKIKEFSIDLIPSNKIFQRIHFIPAGDIDSPTYWKKLSSIDWSSLFYAEGSKGVKFFLDLKHKIQEEFAPDFLLIDSRTGITDISGITLRLLADEVVILAANNQENIYGSKKIINSLTDKSNLLFGKIPKITFILTRLPFTDITKDKEKEFSIIEKRTEEFRRDTLIEDFEILVIHSDRRLEENERPLIGDDYESKSVSISNDYLKLFDKLTIDVLSESEIILFRNKKNAEKEFNRGLTAVDDTSKIEHFSNAIKLDNTQYSYYIRRGQVYKKNKEEQKALHDYKRALELNPESTDVLDTLAGFYSNSDHKKALEYIEKSIKKNPEQWYPYYLKGWVLSKQKKYFEAIEQYSYILETINPNLDDILNSRADLYRITKKYDKAYKDIFKAIELNSEVPHYFGTLAEIYISEGKKSEFYMNLSIALAKGITANSLSSAKDVYEQLLDDEKFLSLLDKYSIDINEVIADQ